ncbi:spidroin-1-like isoform X2 [Amphibalanus amphitrite]|uniref:spidroin-1-like isoform X2 n=1 Tax=Amphibalanus amphitrite TaxID=1232801 RepID=UPI001C90E5F2|nr:spidroin-1-like isoform X2 [Amphibalanus amphitrite]
MLVCSEWRGLRSRLTALPGLFPDDFIKANRGMFRRGRGGGGAGRGSTSTRGGRGRGRGQSRGRGTSRGRSTSRGASRGSARGGRGSWREASRDGRAASTQRGRGRGRGAGRGQRGAARSTSRASFGQKWRAASARMGSHLESAKPTASPLKRKQLAVKAVRGSKLAGRLGTPAKGAKRLTTLALKKKRQALQQLTTSSRQLSRIDARDQIIMKRRGLTTVSAATARRGRGAATRGGARGVTARLGARGAAARRPAPPQQGGRIQVYHDGVPAATPARLRRPLNRTRLTGSSVTAPAGSSLLTVQFKNDIAVRPMRTAPVMDDDEDMDDMLPPSPPPLPPPPPPSRTRGGLDPRIQQEIAAIQARGRSQHQASAEGRQSAGVSNFRPTAATSSRTLNDRFTADRLIYS